MDILLNSLMKNGFDNLIKIILFIFGAIGWVIVFKIKRSYDKKDKRLTIYNDVLEKFEKINQSFTGSFTKDFINASTEMYIAILKNPEDVTNQLIIFFKEIQKQLENGMNIINEIFSQFAKFRLVASPETISLFDLYKADSLSLVNETFEMQKQVFSSLSNIASIEEFKNNINKKIQDKGQALKSLYDKLEKQMKKDVGFN